eukprot:COSAG04_NODE_3212_length_3044_cov_1.932767_2_plen_91_part_00
MEICWNAGANEKATKLLEECGWTVCTGPCDVGVEEAEDLFARAAGGEAQESPGQEAREEDGGAAGLRGWGMHLFANTARVANKVNRHGTY